MADKYYKVQVGVEAKADTRGLDQVNKGLDKAVSYTHLDVYKRQAPGLFPSPGRGVNR